MTVVTSALKIKNADKNIFFSISFTAKTKDQIVVISKSLGFC